MEYSSASPALNQLREALREMVKDMKPGEEIVVDFELDEKKV